MVTSLVARPLSDRYYRIAWIPARQDDRSTLLVYEVTTNSVVHFECIPAEPIESQISQVYQLSAKFEKASVWAFEGFDEALLKALENKGVYVQRVKSSQKALTSAYENLGMLISKRIISFPHNLELIAELEVFKSDFTYSGAPDYTTQIAQQSAIHALCLVTCDVNPEQDYSPYEKVWYHYYPEQLDDRT